MKLTVGERLTASGPAQQPGGYLVTGVVSETPWHGLYTGKKIFYNFDFTGKRPRETDDKEWLDVLLRTIEYPIRDDPVYITTRRAQARAEARHILGNGSSNLWPEPVDLLEIANTRDPFALANGAASEPLTVNEPIVIFAHPHGQPLDDWQQNLLPLASVLSVLAEILQFMSQAHNAGLVLNGLGPRSVIVDRTGRIHYVGTDMVLAAETPFRADWLRYYPPQRFPLGFAAPECFERNQVPDRGSDLYAWGALALSLLTEVKPARLAQEQGRPWAQFGPGHFTHLEKALRGVPPAHVRGWAEELGVDGAGLAEHWPANLVTAFRLLLHPDHRRRPQSVADFRSWILEPPPPPLGAALAIRTGAGAAKIFIDAGEAGPGLQLVVSRQLDGSANSPVGDVLYDGKLASVIDDPLARGAGRITYNLRTRVRRSGGVSMSAPVYATLMAPASATILQLLEAHIGDESLEQAEPAAATLLFRALPAEDVLPVLLSSSVPVVRAWAIRRLEQQVGVGGGTAAGAEPFLWRALEDPLPVLRLAAARAILWDVERLDPARVLRVAEVLGGAHLDDRIEAANSLRSIGLSAAVIEQAIAALEGDRPITCPICRIELTRRDRSSHLRATHGFVDVFGTLLSLPAALEKLFDRIFLHGDFQAHDRLLELLNLHERNGAGAREYAAALAEQVRRPVSRLPLATERLVSCLRRERRLPALAPELLRCADARVREIGRDCLVPELANELRGDHLSAADLRRRLDTICPEDVLEEKILLCLRLPDLGVDPAAANACLAQLQDERPIACPECRARVRVAEVEMHLRRVHGIFEFRGVRRSFGDTRAALLAAVCGASPDYAAWTTLEAIARDQYGERADRRLLSWLTRGLRALERDRRRLGLAALAEVIAAGGSGQRLVPRLAGGNRASGTEAAFQRLALEVAARMTPPVSAAIIEALEPLLSDKRIPVQARQKAVAALMRTTDKDGDRARRLLQAFAANSGKLRAIEKLHALEEYVGQAPAIDALCADLEGQVRMNCPRCATQLRRTHMVGHLWDRHRLLLEGRRVREPWRMIEDWLEDYRLEKDTALLERCRDLARKLGADEGISHLQRLILRHGIEDRDALTALVDAARRQHATLCPHCFSLVPFKEPAVPAPMTFKDNRLAGHDHRLELSENGLWPRLEIEGPDGIIYDGREPGRFLTRNGALALGVGPIVLFTFLVTELLTSRRLHPALGLLLAVGVGLLLGGLIYLLWPMALNLRDRLIDSAWIMLIGARDGTDLTKVDADVLAGLAQASAGWGTPAKRADGLAEACVQIEELARRDPAFVPHLSALWRLAAEDLTRAGADPLGIFAAQVARCFTAKMPLHYAGHLLKGMMSADARTGSAWAQGIVNRLPLILSAQAFAAGMELSDLIDVGHAYQDLSWALGLDNLEHVARLRLLWSMRAARPWQRCGPAATAFDIAGDPEAGGKLLTRLPDLLLAPEGLPLYLCTRGVCFEDAWFGTMPAIIEVRELRKRGGFELIVGPHHFRYDENPEALAGRLAKWFRYYFRDFVPQAASVHAWHAPDVVRKLQTRNGIPCPECKKKILPRPGEVGTTLEKKAAAMWI